MTMHTEQRHPKLKVWCGNDTNYAKHFTSIISWNEDEVKDNLYRSLLY